jgi:hypothetical protein
MDRKTALGNKNAQNNYPDNLPGTHPAMSIEMIHCPLANPVSAGFCKK